MDYQAFLETKELKIHDCGFDINETDINPLLYDFQKYIVKKAIKKGRFGIFASTGLGKTLMQLEIARIIHKNTKCNVLILAPLAVSYQTEQIARNQLNIEINHIKKNNVTNGINIINYERVFDVDLTKFDCVIADESSILKSYMGKTKQFMVESFRDYKYRFVFTATPSPNNEMELLNQAEFLGIMKSSEALAIWFINDSMSFGNYRLKEHCKDVYTENNFYKWVSSWAISITLPSDLGFTDGKFILPSLNINTHVVDIDDSHLKDEDMLFHIPELNATSFHKEKRNSTIERVQKIKSIIDNIKDEQIVIWCDTNYEADELKKYINDSVEIRGSDTVDKKEQSAIDFVNGRIRILISKPSIFGFGLNFQNCRNVIFCGISYSYESYYQSIRRFWRFGQDKEVNVHIVIGENEKHILSILLKKQEMFDELKNGIDTSIQQFQDIFEKKQYKMEYTMKKENGINWELINGDCVEEIKKLPDESVHYSIFSPPFSNYYIYSSNLRDMGNNVDDERFFIQFEFLVKELYRILKSGRLVTVHCKDLIDYKGRDGKAGMRDFPGEIIRLFEKYNFKYHCKTTIWKDPVIEMQRTKSHGLLYKQLRKDSTYSRVGMPDYLVTFRKWGEDVEPVNTKTKGNFPLDKWQEYASPAINQYSTSQISTAYNESFDNLYSEAVWDDIKQTCVLNTRIARSDKDEKHICPLQLDVIERCVELWTNPNDIVFSPFAGIGSELYQSIKINRKAVGIELKEEYFNIACDNLRQVEAEQNENRLFNFEETKFDL